MKQMINNVFWRIGLEITPDTFIQADNSICSQNNLIRRLIAGRYYGLLPYGEISDGGNTGENGHLTFTVKAHINNRELKVEQLACYGTTEAGYLIVFDNDRLEALFKKQLLLPNANVDAFYVVLRTNPFEQVLIEPVDNEEAPEGHSYYELCIRELDKISADELAIIKVDNKANAPVIDSDYIPPCMSVNSCLPLVNVFGTFRNLFAEIRSIIEHKKEQFGKLMYPLTLLHFELDEFSLSEPPMTLIRLIKKFIMTYQFFIPDIRKIVLNDSSGEYNHNDVAIIFRSLLSCLQEVKLIIGKVEMVIEEDFTPRI